MKRSLQLAEEAALPFHDEVETFEHHKDRIRSLHSVTFTMFLDSVMFSICLPSLALFLRYLDCGPTDICSSGEQSDDASIYGVAVGAYALGQLLCSPVAGHLSNRFGPKIPMLFLIGLFTAASVIYALSWNKWMVIVARFLTGLGDGNITICRTYVSTYTSVKERSRYTGMLAVAQALGNSCGFLFGSMFSGVNFFPNSFFAIDEYNAPGYFSVLLGLANIAMVMVLMMDKKEYLERKPYELVHGPDHYTGLLSGSDSFAEEGQEGTVLQVMSDIVNVDDEEEKEEVEKEEEEEEEGDVENVENSVLEEPVTVPWKEVLQCCYLYFSIICVLSLIETLQAPFMIDNYGWSVFNIGMVGMIGGLVGTCCVVVVPYVREVVGIRPTIAVTLLLMAGVLDVATYPWAPSSVAPVWYFILMITVIFIGFSITIFTVTYGLSLILYKLDQGLYTGYMVSSGSFARILGPVWATELYSLNTQGRYAFPATGFICFIGFIVAGTVKWTHPDEVSAWRRERERVKERDKERTGQIRDIDSPTREHGWSSTVTDMMPNEL